MPLDANAELRFVKLPGETVYVQVPAYVSHFATCPYASQHRTGKPGDVVPRAAGEVGDE